jgi:hypothetical protein
MSKKNNKASLHKPQQPGGKTIGISRTGVKIIGAGIGIVVIGYLVLSKTDPAGQNWASMLSPFLLLGGYALIGLGILL